MIGLIGGTGTVGRHLARILIDRGESFRLLTRDVAKARAALGIGDDATPCEPVHADLAQPATLVRALTGIDRLFLSTNVHLEQVALQGRGIAAARAMGVTHVVKLSNLGADADSDFATAAWHGYTERQLEDSGLAWTHLRPHAFMQNLLHVAPDVRRTGELTGPYGNARISMIDARDIAEAADAALHDERHWGRAYDLTGPQALSYAEVAEALSETMGREVRYRDVTPAEARERMIAGGRPDWYTDALLVLYAKWKAGGWDFVSDAVQELTGHPPRNLSTFLADHRAALCGE